MDLEVDVAVALDLDVYVEVGAAWAMQNRWAVFVGMRQAVEIGIAITGALGPRWESKSPIIIIITPQPEPIPATAIITIGRHVFGFG